MNRILICTFLVLFCASFVLASDPPSQTVQTVKRVYVDEDHKLLCTNGPASVDVYAYLEGTVDHMNSIISRVYLIGQIEQGLSTNLCVLNITGIDEGVTYSSNGNFSNIDLSSEASYINTVPILWGGTWDESESFYEVTVDGLASGNSSD